MVKGANGKVYEESYILSATGNPLTKYVNLCQSSGERRDKYAFCRFYGCLREWANRMRDWHWPKINLLLSVLNKPIPMKLD